MTNQSFPDFADVAVSDWREVGVDFIPEVLAAGLRLERISRRYEAELNQCLASEDPQVHLSMDDFRLLALLRRRASDELDVTSIAQMLGLSKAAVSQRVERLKARGLVDIRVRDDRRRRFPLATESGARLADFAFHRVYKVHQRLLRSVPPDALEGFAATLAGIKADLPD